MSKVLDFGKRAQRPPLSPRDKRLRNGLNSLERKQLETSVEWARAAVAFIEELGLKGEFQAWCRGVPCPIRVLDSGELNKPCRSLEQIQAEKERDHG